MSDGKTTVGRPDSVGAQAAKDAGVPVYTIAFGTDHGVIVIPEEPAPVPVDVDHAALEAIAEATGGKAFQAATEGELREVYRNIGSSIGYEVVFNEDRPLVRRPGHGPALPRLDPVPPLVQPPALTHPPANSGE